MCVCQTPTISITGNYSITAATTFSLKAMSCAQGLAIRSQINGRGGEFVFGYLKHIGIFMNVVAVTSDTIRSITCFSKFWWFCKI